MTQSESDSQVTSPQRTRRPDPRIAATKRLIKETTLSLIAEVGFEGATIESIAERSGVSRTTIYRHWPDPSTLFLDAFDPTDPDSPRPALCGDFVTDLDNYINHVAGRLNDERFAGALAAQIDKARRDPQYRVAHLQYSITRNEHGVSIFRAGIASGAIHSDIDPEFETEALLAYLVFQRLMKYRTLDSTVTGQLRDRTIQRCQLA